MRKLLIAPLVKKQRAELNHSFKKYPVEKKFAVPFWQAMEKEMEKMILPGLAVEIYNAKIKGKLKGKTPQERYKNFFKNPPLLRKKFFRQYPRLKNYFRIFLSTSCNYIKGFLNNVLKDKSELQKEYHLKKFLINEVFFPSNGDRHHSGRQLLFFTLNQKKFVFNQTPVNTDQLISFLVKNIINHKLSTPPLKIIKTFSIKDRHYRPFLNFSPANSEKEVKNFYQQLGKIIALTYLLNGIDFHMDNILAVGKNPYLLDVETILTNFEALDVKRWKNLLTTGFLKIKNSKLGDVSSLTGGQQPRISLLDAYPINEGTDNIAVRFKKISNFKPHNRLYFRGKIVDPKDFLPEIINGFDLVYELFLKDKKNIKKLLISFIKDRKIYSRQIFRSTACYQFLVINLFQPKILKNKNVKVWVYNYLLGGFGNKSNLVRNIVSWETEEILNLNIPYFYSRADQNHLYAEGGKIWKNFFKRTPLEYLENKIDSLSLANRQRCEKIIKEALNQ